jgi:hypothetical protein
MADITAMLSFRSFVIAHCSLGFRCQLNTIVAVVLATCVITNSFAVERIPYHVGVEIIPNNVVVEIIPNRI